MESLTEIYSISEVYIVGGGKSLEGYDLKTALKHNLTIGCNKSAFDLNTDIALSIDVKFMENYISGVEDYKGLVCLGLKTYEQFNKYPECHRKYIHSRDGRISEKYPYIYGLNSGHAAVNLAALEGFKTIHLLGFDFSNPGHWHGGYSWSRQDATTLKKWGVDFDLAKPTLDRMGVEVIDYSVNGGLTAYKKRPLEEICKKKPAIKKKRSSAKK